MTLPKQKRLMSPMGEMLHQTHHSQVFVTSNLNNYFLNFVKVNLALQLSTKTNENALVMAI